MSWPSLAKASVNIASLRRVRITQSVWFVAARFLAEFAARASSLITFPLLTRFLSAEGYGVLVQVNVFIGVLVPIACLGLGFSVVRLAAGQSDTSYVSKRFFSTLLLIGGVSTVLGGCMVAAAPVLNALFVKVDWATPVIQWSAPLIVLSAFETILNDYYRARLRILAYSMWQLAQTCVYVAGVAVVLISGGGLLELIFLTLAIKGLLVGLMIVYFVAVGEANLADRLLPSHELMEMVRFGWPIVIMGFSTWMMNFADRAVIGYNMTARDVGVYNAAYTLAGVLTALAAPFWGPLYPVMATHRNKNDRAGLLAACRTYMNAYLSIGIPALFGLCVLAPSLLETLGTAEFAVGYLVFGTVALGLFSVQFAASIHHLVYLHNEPVFLRNVSVLTCVLNILLNFVLVPFIGILGAALATLVAFAVLNLLVFLRVRGYGYQAHELYDFSTIGKFTFCAAAMAVLVHWMVGVGGHGFGPLLQTVGIGGVFYAVALWAAYGFKIRRLLAAI